MPVLSFKNKFNLPGTKLHDRATFFAKKLQRGVKIHTLREDLSGRFAPGKIAPGTLIDCVYWNRTPQRWTFAKLPYNGSTEIEITREFCTTTNVFKYSVYLHGSPLGKLTNEAIYKLAINDGFDSVEDFFTYFSNGFKGRIIHFTDFRY